MEVFKFLIEINMTYFYASYSNDETNDPPRIFIYFELTIPMD